MGDVILTHKRVNHKLLDGLLYSNHYFDTLTTSASSCQTLYTFHEKLKCIIIIYNIILCLQRYTMVLTKFEMFKTDMTSIMLCHGTK